MTQVVSFECYRWYHLSDIINYVTAINAISPINASQQDSINILICYNSIIWQMKMFDDLCYHRLRILSIFIIFKFQKGMILSRSNLFCPFFSTADRKKAQL